MGKIYDVAVIGCGSRGWVLGGHMAKSPDKYRVCALCDIDKTARENRQKEWKVPDEGVFSDEGEFFKEKRGDILVIATQDRDHVRMGIRAMELGYDILMEKPISPLYEELQQMLEANKKYRRKVVVCHVLRYAPAYLKIKEWLEEGRIGRLVHIENTEQVEYWHQAHSFVRGNWRDGETTSPMIMQKCCHDMDLLQYYAGARCESVFSVGETAFFKKENQPEGASDYCRDCKYKLECPYSAERIYIGRWKEKGSPEFGWPFNVVCTTKPNTEESIRKAYENNEYGRCVFACDNNVVDHQQVLMTFENGVKVSHTMSAFTGRGGRRMILHGTLGEIELAEDADALTFYPFGGEKELVKISALVEGEDSLGHGGGDGKLVDALYEVMQGESDAQTALESSVESHLMALCAEQSRKTGKVVKIRK